jgi:hypothetical protein
LGFSYSSLKERYLVTERRAAFLQKVLISSPFTVPGAVGIIIWGGEKEKEKGKGKGKGKEGNEEEIAHLYLPQALGCEHER